MIQYRLLRNNKESGPYTREQLIDMGLKAYDLIWIEGKSAGWRYPSEIDEFKAFAPVAEDNLFDQFYKRPQSKNAAAPQTDTAVATPVKKEKPRFRVSADWRKVEAKNERKTEVAAPQQVQETYKPQPVYNNAPAWEQVYTDWQKKTAPASTTELPKYTATKTDQPQPLETKFSQSLDDIKERYVETVLKPKEKTKGQSKETYYAIALIIMIITIGWALKQKFNDTSHTAERIAQITTQQKAGEEQAVVMNENENNSLVNNNTESTSTNNVENTAAGNSAQKINPEPQSTIADKQVPPTYTATKEAEKKSAQKKVILAPHKKISNNSSVIKNTTNNATNNNTRSVTRVDNNSTVKARPVVNNETPVVEATKQKPPVNRKKSIDDYIVLSGANKYKANGIENVNLTVSNVADFPIDLVVIDVHYYSAGGRYQKGETLYVKNIGANQNVDVKVPDSPNSASVQYKVSMLTSEQKTLYLIAD